MIFTSLAITLASQVWAQNPIISSQFTADPTARVFNGKVYLYPSHDIPSPMEKLKEVFNDVFFGKNKVYFEAGDSMGYISDVKNHDVRTEGMSYGLMLAVQFGRKDIFDRIWRWGKKYMQNQSGPWKGYFAWSCKTDGTRNANGPASDGELYYVTSLIFASNRWGNDTGINYLKEAQFILDCSMQKAGNLWRRAGRLVYGYGKPDASEEVGQERCAS